MLIYYARAQGILYYMQRTRIFSFIAICILMLSSSVLIFCHLQTPPKLPRAYYSSHSLDTIPTPIQHIVLILEENKPATDITTHNAPYTSSLIHTYATTAHYYAITHPSLPNYIALTSGTTASITSDCSPPSTSCQANVRNIADSIEQSGRTWKEYAESMPSACYRFNNGAYVVRHNPFMYYPDIIANPFRCMAHVVPYTQLASDLATTTSLPDFSFITPNVCNDMHNCSIQTGDKWLSQEVPKILHAPAFVTQHSLLIIAFDEGENDDNNTLTIFAGSAAKHGYVSQTYYSHYSLLHTIEAAWSLSPLTNNDRGAPVMSDMLQ